MTKQAILLTDQMTMRFGGLVAVDRLDLAVKESAIHSIIGPNGAGKTTVFNCIMEFYSPIPAASGSTASASTACFPTALQPPASTGRIKTFACSRIPRRSRTSWWVCTSI